MSYQKSTAYLFALQKFGIKLGLTNISNLLAILGNPHKEIPCIHVAGTNGKGSTSAVLSSILSKAGYKVGLYTSPHLTSFTERIRINNRKIRKKDVCRLTELLKNKAENIESITFFEIVTAMALLYFKEEQVDLSILEVGMGGRLDATNIVSPLISIITNISKEHEYYLGNTIMKIANEKAGIIKKGSDLITGATQSKVLSLFKSRCTTLQTRCYQLGKDFYIKETSGGALNYHGIRHNYNGLKIGLLGDYQLNNAANALAAVELLIEHGYQAGNAAIRQGIAKVSWPGRCEIVNESPMVVLDGAHNPVAMKILKQSLVNNFDFRKVILILGVMEDKNIKGMLREILPLVHQAILCKPDIDRAASTKMLAKIVKDFNVKCIHIEDVRKAVLYALSTAHQKDLICITGSLFTVGEAREIFKSGAP
jgi:dihydrofolate synthase/folylpolyglutamate synthase